MGSNPDYLVLHVHFSRVLVDGSAGAACNGSRTQYHEFGPAIINTFNIRACLRGWATFLGPFSEINGRVIVLQLANLFYLAFNLGCGFAKTKGQLIAFRFLAGLGGSAPLAVCEVFSFLAESFHSTRTHGFGQTSCLKVQNHFLTDRQLGGGVLSDVWRAEERGKSISIYSLAPLLGPAVGPIGKSLR
jgi:MFS family permease